MTRIQRDMSGHEANIRFQERNEHDRSPLRPYDGAASRAVSRLGRLAHVAVRTVIT